MSKKITGPLVAGLLASAVVVGAAGAAHASGQNAVINDDEMVFFYNSNFRGSYSDFAGAKSDLASYTYIKTGLAGFGQVVKNNTASVYNYRARSARVYYNSGFAGKFDQVGADNGRNLVTTYNDNASFQWGIW
jgi:hypothetical protein